MSQNDSKAWNVPGHTTTESTRAGNAGAHPVLAVPPAEAARLCSIGRTTLYAALSSGALKSVKIGTRRLITLDALRDFLKSHEAPTGK